MSENHIEDADIVVDLAGGRLVVQTYRERIDALKAQLVAAENELTTIKGHINFLLEADLLEKIGADEGDERPVQLRVMRILTELNAAENRLKEYGRHKPLCPANSRFTSRKCPHCGGKHTRWRSGVGFDQELRCLDCDGPAWKPKIVPGKCTCGFEQALAPDKGAKDD